MEHDESAHHRKEKLHIANEVVHDFFRANDFSKNENGIVDLDGRQFSEKTLEHFGVSSLPNRNLLAENFGKLQLDSSTLEMLGLLKKSEQGTVFDFFKNRILFPIRNVNGKIAGFAGRKRSNAPAKTAKYVNSPESEIFKKSQLLFGLHENLPAIRESKTAILVEGYFDCLSVWQTGRKNVVASCGTAVNEAQAKLLAKFTEKIILLFDGDDAGRNATEKTWHLLEKQGLFVQVCELPAGDDPDSFIRQRGAEAFEKLLAEQTCDAVIWLAKTRTANAASDSLAQHQLSARQDFPSADPALLTRTILLPFSKRTFSEEEQQQFLNLRKMEDAGGLSWNTSDVAWHADFFQSQFVNEHSRLKRSLTRTVNEQFSGEKIERLIAGYAILLTTCFTLQEKLALPNWFLKKLETAVANALIAHRSTNPMICQIFGMLSSS